MSALEEIRRRRTFAIISHPDAGKTTLTEKLLYHGGVIHETGEVKGKSGTKAVTSDWMELERQKGISITSSVMTFDYADRRINLLDTPGHKDFSEDTYRVLMAVDSACMLIDVAKGVEERTRKLYEVCRLRKIPIFTFINKLDREGKAPLDLIDEVENTLGMSCYPITWPLGIGPRFVGIYDRLNRRAILYNQKRDDDQVQIVPIEKVEDLKAHLSEELFQQVAEELDLIEGVLPPFDREVFLRGEISPVTFGSARQNFAVDHFLKFFAEQAPGPQPRQTRSGEVIDPEKAPFSAFVFKIQANMDRKHRDRIAFLRICSGEFQRGMKVAHSRIEKELRLNYSNQFVAASRETVESAYAGDILGVNDSGNFAIGDVVAVDRVLQFDEIPRFAPEIFSRITVSDAMKRRKMQEALIHLSQEGAIQIFIDPAIGMQDPILGVVGELQLEVLVHRMQDEYGLDVRLSRLPMTVARWPRNSAGQLTREVKGATTVYEDLQQNPVVLLNQEWDLNWLKRENPTLDFVSSR